MIIEFKVENFLSFKDLTTLSMVSAKSFKEHKNTHTIFIDDKLSLLKSAIIYGNNASGKTNMLRAISFMKHIVFNSYRDALIDNIDKEYPLTKYTLNSKNEEETSFFEISFLQNGTKYRYGFELDYDKVVAEWLYHTTSKEVYLFKRNLQKIEVNKSAFREALGKEEDVKENVLFLSVLATLGKEISTSIMEWFRCCNIIDSTQNKASKHYTIEKLKSDKDFFSWVLHFIKYLGISNLAMGEQFSENRKLENDFLVSYHRKFDANNMLIGNIGFDFEDGESEGTKKLLYLLGPWYDTLKNNKVLVIDEIDSKLHSHLTLRLLDFFHQSNQGTAQLICAAHDTALLNKETFRRDQIWFVEKNQFGASELVSLADFKTDTVRNKSAFYKNYANGKYGAIPYFELDPKLNQLLYGQTR